MSRVFTLANLIHDRIETLDGLDGKCIVDRQNDLENELFKRVFKVGGVLVLVEVDRAVNGFQNRKSFELRATFIVSVILNPIIRAEDADRADDIIQAIGSSLQGWFPDEISSNGVQYLRVTNCEFPANDKYSIARLIISETGA